MHLKFIIIRQQHGKQWTKHRKKSDSVRTCNWFAIFLNSDVFLFNTQSTGSKRGTRTPGSAAERTDSKQWLEGSGGARGDSWAQTRPLNVLLMQQVGNPLYYKCRYCFKRLLEYVMEKRSNRICFLKVFIRGPPLFGDHSSAHCPAPLAHPILSAALISAG